MGQRGSGTGGWWLWLVTGVVVTIGAVVLLEPWFRVSSWVAAGWGSLAVTAFQGRRRVDVRRPVAWVLCAAMVLFFVGAALLLGAAGLSDDDDRTDSVVPGAVLGAVMVAADAIALLVLRALHRRKAVTDEVERHRAEEAALPTTTADDLT